MRGTIAISWGPYGGFYLHRRRLCVGRLAITWLSVEVDDLMEAYAERPNLLKRAAKAERAAAAAPAWAESLAYMQAAEVRARWEETFGDD